MSKRSGKIDPNQLQINFKIETRVANHLAEKQELLEDMERPSEPYLMGSYEEACIELAAAVKRALRQCHMSRPDVVDGINAYFGWSTETGKSLSIHMLNHYLSKPAEYPLPGAMLFAICHVTGSLGPCKVFAEAEGGDVISKGDKQHLMLGKMEAAVWEMNRLKKELKKGG